MPQLLSMCLQPQAAVTSAAQQPSVAGVAEKETDTEGSAGDASTAGG